MDPLGLITASDQLTRRSAPCMGRSQARILKRVVIFIFFRIFQTEARQTTRQPVWLVLYHWAMGGSCFRQHRYAYPFLWLKATWFVILQLCRSEVWHMSLGCISSWTGNTDCWDIWGQSRWRKWQLSPVPLPGKIFPWQEEPGRRLMVHKRVGHDWATAIHFFTESQSLTFPGQRKTVTPISWIFSSLHSSHDQLFQTSDHFLWSYLLLNITRKISKDRSQANSLSEGLMLKWTQYLARKRLK